MFVATVVFPFLTVESAQYYHYSNYDFSSECCGAPQIHKYSDGLRLRSCHVVSRFLSLTFNVWLLLVSVIQLKNAVDHWITKSDDDACKFNYKVKTNFNSIMKLCGNTTLVESTDSCK